MNKATTSLQTISDYFIQTFPAINEHEQKLALVLYRLLSLGEPVNVDQVQAETGLTAKDIEQKLQTWPGVFFDDEQHVIGFWGITVQPMPHRLKFNDHVAYAWCAWDTLFIPELLNETVTVESACPVTDSRIELVVSPTHAETVNDKPVFLSFLKPDPDKFNDDVTTSFCHFVYFFDSKVIAEQWLAGHPGTFLLTLDEAFQIARQVNAGRYHSTL